MKYIAISGKKWCLNRFK